MSLWPSDSRRGAWGGGGAEVLHARLPMTGEVHEFALGDLEWFAVLP